MKANRSTRLFAALAATWLLGSVQLATASLIAETGFNDQSGINADAHSGSPYALDGPVLGSGGSEIGWDGAWFGDRQNGIIQDAVVWEGDLAARLDPTNGYKRNLAEPQTGLITIEQFVQLTDGARMVVYHDQRVPDNQAFQGPIWQALPDRTFRVLDGTGDACGSCGIEETGLTWQPGQWYKITLHVDVTGGIWDFAVNDQQYDAPDPLGFRGTPQFLDRIRFQSEGSAPVFLDALSIHEDAALRWDGQGNGNWEDIDAVTGNTYWVYPAGGPSAVPPNTDTRVDISSHTVTVATDAQARNLLVDGGRLIIAEDALLTVGEWVSVESGAFMTLRDHATLVADEATVSSLVAGDGATIETDLTITKTLAATDTLTVDGDLMMAQNSVFEVTFDGAEASRVDATNDVKLSSRSSLQVKIDGDSPFSAGTYTLLTAGNDLLGRFGHVTELGAYASEGENNDGLTYSDTELTLTVDMDLHPGDADLSGATDLSDFNIWNANKFVTDTDWGAGDFNGNGQTDLSDFNIWNAHKFMIANGGAAPAPAEVPEPGTLGLLIVAMAIALGSRCRRSR